MVPGRVGVPNDKGTWEERVTCYVTIHVWQPYHKLPTIRITQFSSNSTCFVQIFLSTGYGNEERVEQGKPHDCMTTSLLLSGYWCAAGAAVPTGPCMAGYYCKEGSNTSTQYNVQEGHFSDAGAADQSPCQPGSYSPVCRPESMLARQL